MTPRTIISPRQAAVRVASASRTAGTSRVPGSLSLPAIAVASSLPWRASAFGRIALTASSSPFWAAPSFGLTTWARTNCAIGAPANAKPHIVAYDLPTYHLRTETVDVTQSMPVAMPPRTPNVKRYAAWTLIIDVRMKPRPPKTAAIA